jgi:IS30 family transposase
VIYSELKINSDKRDGSYRALLTEKKCSERHKNKNKKIKFSDELKIIVEQKIKEDYIPQQVCGYLKKEEVCLILKYVDLSC